MPEIKLYTKDIENIANNRRQGGGSHTILEVCLARKVLELQKTIKEILTIVYDSLDERGYNAIDQMVGYILSGDPSYITSHNNARNVIGRIERDDLVEELIKAYLDK